MIDLLSCDESSLDAADAKTKESKGLLRRAFSSRKKKKKPMVSATNNASKSSSKIPDLIVTPTTSPNYLSPDFQYPAPGREATSPSSPTGGSPRLGVKAMLRAVRSNPISGDSSYYVGDR